MVEETKVVIVGYGNVGKGVHRAIERNPDMNLIGIISRDVERTQRELKVVSKGEMLLVCDPKSDAAANSIGADVAILCGGSKQDLPEQGPHYAQFFNTVDSFDTHAHIPPYIDKRTQEKMAGYLSAVHVVAKPTKHSCAIALGWDPGIITGEKCLMESFLRGARAYVLYGLTERGGVSQGHSDAARKVKGVVDARSYTHAIPKAIELIRAGGNPDLKPGEMHWREVFVCAAEGEDLERIASDIVTDPEYYADYSTFVRFISQEEMKQNHSDMPHDGLAIIVGETSLGKKSIIEYKLQLDSNPEFTASVMVAYARAVHRANKQGRFGALRSCLDFTPAEVSPLNYDELVRKI